MQSIFRPPSRRPPCFPSDFRRAAGLVGKFVEFFGEGAAALTVTDRATIANMAPEYGATMGYFGVDEKTLAYLRGTGRSDELCETYENYYKSVFKKAHA